MRGGIAVVQDPSDALYDGMPRSAIENVDVDYIVPIEAMASLLTRLANEPVSEESALPVSEQMEIEADMAELDEEAMQKRDRPGTPSAFVCPDCGGTLFELQDGDYTRYRCRVGHAFSPENLLAAQSDRLEDAFWVALRALEESAALSRRMVERARQRGHLQSVARFEERAKAAQERAELVRDVLLTGTLNRRGEGSPSVHDEFAT
jgi:two-component system chemotaxis response regulator CheB